MSQIMKSFPVIFCTPAEFFDKLEELYLGQVIVVTRYKKEKDEITRECFMRTGSTTYQRITNNEHDTKISDICNTTLMNGDENSVIIREK